MAGGNGGGKPDEKAHEQARDLAEDALDKMAHGDDKGADKLIEASRKIDPTAAEEVVQDLEEDTGSDPNAAKKAGG